MIRALASIAHSTKQFHLALIYFIKGGSYDSAKYFHFKGNKEARVYAYSLSLMFLLWDKPHYRNANFQEDLKKNLRNVAIPGTGVPLSVFAWHKYLMYFFVFALLPLILLVSACLVVLKRKGKDHSSFWDQVSSVYEKSLLHPDDWFSLWQLNCRLSSFHHYVTQSEQYKYENKWDFLLKSMELGLAGTPVLDIPEIVVKDRNEEGGMGIHVFRNALEGGDWIIQKKLLNAKEIAEFLPSTAPLSTFRVLTCSTAWLDQEHASLDRSITPLTCVFRAGFANAKTDHSSVLFNVNLKSGSFDRGTSNKHWYKTGLQGLKEWLGGSVLDRLLSEHDVLVHPDTGVEIFGRSLGMDRVKELLEVSTRAHFMMLGQVPLVGWDVALTPEGTYLLEANLSCNFFRGSYDRSVYMGTLDMLFTALDCNGSSGARTAPARGSARG
jgi:hypothetical protein